MRSFAVQGIVLKRLDVNEADRIVTLFTKTHGKLHALAKGVRKPGSKRAGSLELFNEIKAVIHQSKASSTFVLGDVQLLDPHLSWRKALGRVIMAYQLVEAVDKLTPDNQPHPAVFYKLKDYLSRIRLLDQNWKKITDGWLVALITELGYWPGECRFSGNIRELVESITSSPFFSPGILKRLSRGV